ncbi:alpha/beta fold hydrolase [Chloroflexota bacterium]
MVVHGLAEHSGRYGNLVDYFVPRGYAVFSLDHRGHGKSEGLRGYVDRFTDYLDDLKIFMDHGTGPGHPGFSRWPQHGRNHSHRLCGESST